MSCNKSRLTSVVVSRSDDLYDANENRLFLYATAQKYIAKYVTAAAYGSVEVIHFISVFVRRLGLPVFGCSAIIIFIKEIIAKHMSLAICLLFT